MAVNDGCGGFTHSASVQQRDISLFEPREFSYDTFVRKRHVHVIDVLTISGNGLGECMEVCEQMDGVFKHSPSCDWMDGVLTHSASVQ